jgi:hypothetical protein
MRRIDLGVPGGCLSPRQTGRPTVGRNLTANSRRVNHPLTCYIARPPWWETAALTEHTCECNCTMLSIRHISGKGAVQHVTVGECCLEADIVDVTAGHGFLLNFKQKEDSIHVAQVRFCEELLCTWLQ